MALFGLGKPDIEKLKARRDINGLIKAFGYQKNETVKVSASAALLQIGEPIVSPLIASLRNATGVVRWSGFRVLAEIGAPSVPPLTALLNDPDITMRFLAVLSLGSIGDNRAIEPLNSAVSDSEFIVSRAASSALRRIADPLVPPPVSSKTLEENVEEPHGIDVMQAQFHINRGAALRDDQAPDLIIALHDPDRDVRQHAAWRLGYSCDPSAADALIVALNDPEKSVRKTAAESLGRLGDINAVEPLLIVMLDELRNFGEVQACAAEALGKIGDIRALEPLIALLGEHGYLLDQKDPRTSAAEALGRLRDPRAIKPLLAAYNDTILDSQERAFCDALVNIGSSSGIPILTALLDAQYKSYGTWTRLCWALRKISDTQMVEPLIAALTDLDKCEVRSKIVEILGDLGDTRALDPLIKLLKDPCLDLRATAVEALGKFRDTRAVEPLIAALHGPELDNYTYGYKKDEQWAVSLRRKIVEALDNIGDVRAGPELIELIPDPRGSTRDVAALALEKMF